MLFDERDLNVFNNSEAQKYFMEIAQSYYCKNYRSSIVMLYSFVIYDLYMKMKVMSHEGDTKATTKLKEIEAMIKQAEENAEADNKRKEMVEVKNESENFIFQAKKALEDLADEATDEEKTTIDKDIDSMRIICICKISNDTYCEYRT